MAIVRLRTLFANFSISSNLRNSAAEGLSWGKPSCPAGIVRGISFTQLSSAQYREKMQD